MKTFLEIGGLCTFRNEVLHVHVFVRATSFETLRVMKDKVAVAPEDELVLDIVDAALAKTSHSSMRVST